MLTILRGRRVFFFFYLSVELHSLQALGEFKFSLFFANKTFVAWWTVYHSSESALRRNQILRFRGPRIRGADFFRVSPMIEPDGHGRYLLLLSSKHRQQRPFHLLPPRLTATKAFISPVGIRQSQVFMTRSRPQTCKCTTHQHSHPY
jgi:hypothetical protein